MRFRRLGGSGLLVSEVGLGCNNFGGRLDAGRTEQVVKAALDAGVNLFDTADVYGETRSEEFLGQALGARRREAIIATKFGLQMGDRWKQGGSRRWILQAVEDSLKRLGTDYIDLYQLHRFDPATPLEETLRALDDLVTAGKVRYVGCSNFAAWQLADAAWTAKVGGCSGFVSVQNEFSLLVRGAEPELLPACARFGVGFLPYFPLASGMLSGKYRRGQAPGEGTRLAGWGPRADRVLNESNFDTVERLAGWAEARGHSLLELAFAWLLGHAEVPSVIAGATSPEQVRANVAAADWRLTPAEVAEVSALAE
ncbi:aldo/keto reductase [Phenylobacterium sp. LjRoot219]|uniref:aldo/keto reductase n=1 Tax=Phenylobacterium sp. LjRoot219 TaxID=3342283 RepID=UPI003ECECAB6